MSILLKGETLSAPLLMNQTQQNQYYLDVIGRGHLTEITVFEDEIALKFNRRQAVNADKNWRYVDIWLAGEGRHKRTASTDRLFSRMARILKGINPKVVFNEKLNVISFPEPWKDLKKIAEEISQNMKWAQELEFLKKWFPERIQYEETDEYIVYKLIDREGEVKAFESLQKIYEALKDDIYIASFQQIRKIHGLFVQNIKYKDLFYIHFDKKTGKKKVVINEESETYFWSKLFKDENVYDGNSEEKSYRKALEHICHRAREINQKHIDEGEKILPFVFNGEGVLDDVATACSLPAGFIRTTSLERRLFQLQLKTQGEAVRYIKKEDILLINFNWASKKQGSGQIKLSLKSLKEKPSLMRAFDKQLGKLEKSVEDYLQVEEEFAQEVDEYLDQEVFPLIRSWKEYQEVFSAAAEDSYVPESLIEALNNRLARLTPSPLIYNNFQEGKNLKFQVFYSEERERAYRAGSPKGRYFIADEELSIVSKIIENVRVFIRKILSLRFSIRKDFSSLRKNNMKRAIMPEVWIGCKGKVASKEDVGGYLLPGDGSQIFFVKGLSDQIFYDKEYLICGEADLVIIESMGLKEIFLADLEKLQGRTVEDGEAEKPKDDRDEWKKVLEEMFDFEEDFTRTPQERKPKAKENGTVQQKKKIIPKLKKPLPSWKNPQMNLLEAYEQQKARENSATVTLLIRPVSKSPSLQMNLLEAFGKKDPKRLKELMKVKPKKVVPNKVSKKEQNKIRKIPGIQINLLPSARTLCTKIHQAV